MDEYILCYATGKKHDIFTQPNVHSWLGFEPGSVIKYTYNHVHQRVPLAAVVGPNDK